MSKWPTVKLAEVATVFNGKTPSKSDQRENGYPVLKIRDVNELGYFRGRFDSFVDNSLAESFPQKQIKEGDSLILNAAHNADYVGSKIYFSEPDVFGALATGEWTIIRPNIDKLFPRYAYYWTTTSNTRHAIREAVKGIHLYPKDIMRMEIPLPTIGEQRRIAEMLDKASLLQQKRRLALGKLDELMQAMFLNKFTGIEAEKWPKSKIGELAENRPNSTRTGPFGSQLLHSEFVESGILVLGIDNVVQNKFKDGKPRYITHKKYSELKRYKVFPGDVLITIMGTCGRCAVVPSNIPEAINTKHLCAITLDKSKCHPLYLQAVFLRHPHILRQLKDNARGAIMDGLNMGIIKSLEIALPPLALQKEFAMFMESIDAMEIMQESSLDMLSKAFNTMQTKLFSGDL